MAIAEILHGLLQRPQPKSGLFEKGLPKSDSWQCRQAERPGHTEEIDFNDDVHLTWDVGIQGEGDNGQKPVS